MNRVSNSLVYTQCTGQLEPYVDVVRDLTGAGENLQGETEVSFECKLCGEDHSSRLYTGR